MMVLLVLAVLVALFGASLWALNAEPDV